MNHREFSLQMSPVANTDESELPPDLLHGIPVEPPSPDSIRNMRMAYELNQTQAAAAVGVAVQTWAAYETAAVDGSGCQPSSAIWGLFLLAIGQHPRGRFVKG